MKDETMTDTILVLSNFPDAAAAEALARNVVEAGLAACVNILPGMTSFYRWEGRVEQASEIMVLIKSTRAQYQALEAAITAAHAYEVPEIIALPIVAGLPAYMEWVRQSTGGGNA